MSERVTYRVVGRYMDGKNITGYHYVGSDYSQMPVTKERAIYLIGKGLVENMRVQTNTDGELIIRGKGVNLTELPIYDTKKQEFRGNGNQQNAGGQQNRAIQAGGKQVSYTIVKRIMSKTTCVGYLVKSSMGNDAKLQRDQVIKLGIEKLLTNASVQKYREREGAEPKIILRGINCDLSKLPILIVNEYGKIIDPAADIKEVVIRAARMKRGGLIKHSSGAVKTFENGDYIVVKADGKLGVIKGDEFIRGYEKDSDHNEATCDPYLSNLAEFKVEIFGSQAVELKPEQVKTWAMAKKKA